MTAAARLVAAAFVAGALAGKARGADRGRPADDAGWARRQVPRVNDRAALGKFREATPLFPRAFEGLKDPALRFTGAECHRRLGNEEEALPDYVPDPHDVWRDAAEPDAPPDVATRDVDARDATASGDTARRG